MLRLQLHVKNKDRDIKHRGFFYGRNDLKNIDKPG
jgi:hypothetical protein